MSLRINRRAALAFIVLIIIILAAVLLGNHRHPIKKKTTVIKPVSAAATSAYHYQNLDSYKLGANGSAIVFDKPAEFKQFGVLPKKAVQALLIHFPSARVVPDYGRIAVYGFSYDQKSQYAVTLADALSDKNPSDFQAYNSSFKDFINPRLPLSYKISDLSAYKPFSSSTIHTNAWTADFTAASSDSQLPKINGRFMISVGASQAYYFMAENVASTWQANSATWQQVFNSVKIDQ